MYFVAALLPVLLALCRPISGAACPAPRACNPLLPSGYMGTAFTQSRAQIESYTKRSIDNLLSYTTDNGQFQGGGGFWTAQNGWTNAADYDALRGSKVYEQQVSAAQDALARSTGKGTPLVNEYNDDAGWAALANLRAYEAYGDQKYLDRAVAVWDYLNTQFVDDKVLSKGYLEGIKNADVKVQRSCIGKSMVGGVYWVNGLPYYPDQAKLGTINAVSTGLYALLGAELCVITKDNDKYLTRSYLSAQWLDNHMVTPEGLLVDNINGADCKVTDWKFTYNAALYISTYALLSTLNSNATALALAERTAKESIRTKQWNSDNGIIKEGAGDASGSNDGIGFKSVLIRSLYRSFPYFQDEGLKSGILDYVNIQYYGMTQLDADSKTQPVKYGRNWAGPGYTVSTAHAQLAALDVLNALTLNPASAFLKADNKNLPVIKQQARTGC